MGDRTRGEAEIEGRAAPRDRASLEARLRAGEAVVAGVLSGTSADGIDVALVRFDARGRLEPLAFRTLPFARELGERLGAVLAGAPCGLREVALLHRDLGRAFGAAVRRVARDAAHAVDLVGSHGQTVWHHDGVEASGPATLQLGDGDFVAVESGAWVASDFRQRDVAAGGEGAPLVALADAELFAELERPAAILNLGGMANLTLLPADASEPVLAFDTGPAGSLLDGLSRRFLDAPFDDGGRVAASGRADEGTLATWLEHPFFAASPPKSTGRDTFGEAWVDTLVARAAASGLLASPAEPADLFATAVELVAASVARGLADHASPGCARLVVAGGGARNAALSAALERRTGLPVVTSAAVGVDPDAREAYLFAVLARRAVLGEPSTRPGATGARAGEILGKISPPPSS